MRFSGYIQGPVVQLVRTPPCHGGGQGFESPLGRFSVYKCFLWGLSSAGRASALQAEGHRFEPCRPHCSLLVVCFRRCGSMAEQLICNQQVEGSSPPIGYPEIYEWNQQRRSPVYSIRNNFILSRGRAVWKLVGLITRRSVVQILPPLLSKKPVFKPNSAMRWLLFL